MCILFGYVAGPKPSRNAQKYLKLALAFNRDEQYARPTSPANFWKSDSNILAGQDNESGGTWLGLNKKTGRIAALTSIMGGTIRDPKNPKVSRGAVLTDFLISGGNLNGRTYCTNLYQDPAILDRYNKFNLITIDLCPGPKGDPSEYGGSYIDSNHLPVITYVTNATKSPPVFIDSSQDQYFGVGNSVWQRPFKKVKKGCQTFQAIFEKCHKKAQQYSDVRDLLTEELLGFLKSTEKHSSDEEMDSLASEQVKPFTHRLCSNFVSIPETQYGTRTHTLIFLDSENYVDFYEWTMKEPINIEHPTWLHSKFNFRLCS